ncbi:hypothetical protein H5410_038228 [Solanum commersonii]|uniref:Uncharacterized protein n=1 Tax=Solanum commersonii TaxID=4109 RepID=A0A9J5YCI2_SOLCO|nr:hypothetical protein H5410_038228 [Solanum commersonii]
MEIVSGILVSNAEKSSIKLLGLRHHGRVTIDALIFGPGITPLRNTATEIFSGKVSMALEMASPPTLWPTRTTFSSVGSEVMNSISGLNPQDIKAIIVGRLKRIQRKAAFHALLFRHGTPHTQTSTSGSGDQIKTPLILFSS